MHKLKVHRNDAHVYCSMSDSFDDVADCQTCSHNVKNRSDDDTIYCDYECNEPDEREITVNRGETITLKIKGDR